MIYRIVKYGDEILEKVAAGVTEFGTPELRKLATDMFETMYSARGIGLAAPQIGLSQQMTVVDITAGEDPSKQLVLLNPEILETSGRQVGEEGCLSIPGFREDVARAMVCRVRAQNLEGEFFEINAEELLARVFQHEIDHLNGVLFIDRISRLKRDLIRRKIRKLIKAGEWK
jgi:peptide deformylase